MLSDLRKINDTTEANMTWLWDGASHIANKNSCLHNCYYLPLQTTMKIDNNYHELL